MLRNDCIVDLEAIIETLIKTKGYTDIDVLDCMAHIIKNKSKGKQSDLFPKLKKPKKILEIDPEAERLSQLFIDLCCQRIKPPKPMRLSFGAKELMCLYDLVKDWKQIEWAIRYSQDVNNCKDKYMPVVRSFQSLREKYQNLLAHKERNENIKKNQAFNSNQSSYTKPTRVVVYYSNGRFFTYNEIRTACPFKPNVELDVFKKMSAERKKEYFEILTEEEKIQQAENIKKIMEEMKKNLQD